MSGYSDVFAASAPREARQPTPFDGVLELSRDLVCARLAEAVGAMLDKADESLLTLMQETYNREERALFEEARALAMEERGIIEAGFKSRYLEEFKRQSDKVRKIGEPADAVDYSLDTMQLVADDDLEETIKFNDMATKLRAYCEEELVALDQRVGVLLGDATLQASDNPFSPQVICDAYKHACRQLDADVKIRRVLLRLFDDHVLDDIRSVYKAVNAMLVQNSILPKIRFSVARDQSRKPDAPGAAGTAEASAPPIPANIAAIPAGDLFSILQQLAANSAGITGALAGHGVAGGVAGSGIVAAGGGVVGAGGGVVGAGGGVVGAGGGGFVAAGGGPGMVAGATVHPVQAIAGGTIILQGAELLGSLTRVQRGDLADVSGAGGGLIACVADPGTTNVLRELKGTSIGAGMQQLDLLTLDIVAMLFDQLFDDPKVPNGVKGLIGRLQIPVLKVAIADKSFFSTKTHPARRMLDAIGEIALRLPSDFGAQNPLFERLHNMLQELVDGFQEDLEIFTTVRDKLLTLLAEEDQRIAEETELETKRVEELENLSLAKSVAEGEIKARINAYKVPTPVREFLAQQWLKLLLIVHVREGKEGGGWKSAVELMDTLLWSIEPKTTPEECRKLGAMVPQLIKDLATGMKSAGIDDDVRESFFAELMTYHTQAIGVNEQARLKDEAAEASLAVAPAPTTAEIIKASLRAIGKEPAAAPSLGFTPQITVKNPYGEGEVSVDSNDLDFTSIADNARAKREESIRRAIDAIGLGTWVEFRELGEANSRRAAKLIFISPRKSRYLFAVDRRGKQIIQCTRAEFARRLRSGEITRLDSPPEESLFDRIMGALLGKLRGPAREALGAA